MAEPKFRQRSEQTFDHHLIRLNDAKMIKNAGYGENVVLKEVRHEHFFHTKNSMGHSQEICAPVGGHFHEVKWKVGKPDKDGFSSIEAVCGPPLKKVQSNSKTGTKTTHEPVKFKDGTVDTHRHDCTLEGSEKLSQSIISGIQESNAKQIGPVDVKVKTEPASADVIENDR